MKLKWYGHASFLVTADNGTKIVTDPYTPETSGYSLVEDQADVVIMSSDNDRSHCRADLVPGNPVVINALALAQEDGQRLEKGITFQAVEAMEALDHKYHDPEQNAMYRFTVDGISIGHMGDVGNPLTEAHLAFFKDIDVLLALTGDHPTITLDDLKIALDAIRPRLVVPMHFQTLSYKPRNIFWIEAFLKYFDPSQIDMALSDEVILTKASLPEPTRVLVLDYVHSRVPAEYHAAH